MTSRCAVRGGTDFILALSAGHFRQIGLGSFSSLLCYANSNELVMTFGTRELLPAASDTPVIFGLNATDPTIRLYDYLKKIKENVYDKEVIDIAVMRSHGVWDFCLRRRNKFKFRRIWRGKSLCEAIGI